MGGDLKRGAEKMSDAETRRAAARTPEDRFFVWLVVAISIAFAWIVAPMYGAVLWGVVFAILFAGMHRRVLKTIRRPNIAALATLFIILVIVILPLTILTISVVSEASEVVEKVQSGDIDLGKKATKIFDSMPPWANGWLQRFGLSNVSDLKTRFAEGISKVSQVVVVQVINIGQGTFNVLLTLFVMLYLLFFLLRDGPELQAEIKRRIPLRKDDKDHLFEQIVVVTRATIKGNMVVSLLQGALGGLIFWILGIQGALLWGALMAVLSLLPAVGAALVWLPVAIYLLSTGSVGKGMVLLVFGVVVISLVDNVVRPILVGKDTKMPDYVVLISTLGGIAVFGINGFVIGPLIAALFISVWETYGKRKSRFAGGADAKKLEAV